VVQREMLGGTEAVRHVRSVCEALGMLGRLPVLGHCCAGPSLPASIFPGAWGDSLPRLLKSPSLRETPLGMTGKGFTLDPQWIKNLWKPWWLALLFSVAGWINQEV